MYPANLRYSREHEWARRDGGEIVVGVTHYAQEELGDVVFVELPQVGDHFDTNVEFGTVESVKAVSPLYLPLAGEVTAVNDALETQPELVNSSPYTDGWMVRLRADDADQLDSLLAASAYEQLVNELRA